MDGVSTCVLGSLDDFINHKIALYGGRGADMHRFIGHTHMERFAVSIRVNRDCGNAHFARGLHHAAGYLAAISNQDFFDFMCFRFFSHYIRNTPKRDSSNGALAAIAKLSPKTRLVSVGAIIPSSQMRALA